MSAGVSEKLDIKSKMMLPGRGLDLEDKTKIVAIPYTWVGSWHVLHRAHCGRLFIVTNEMIYKNWTRFGR